MSLQWKVPARRASLVLLDSIKATLAFLCISSWNLATRDHCRSPEPRQNSFHPWPWAFGSCHSLQPSLTSQGGLGPCCGLRLCPPVHLSELPAPYLLSGIALLVFLCDSVNPPARGQNCVCWRDGWMMPCHCGLCPQHLAFSSLPAETYLGQVTKMGVWIQLPVASAVASLCLLCLPPCVTLQLPGLENRSEVQLEKGPCLDQTVGSLWHFSVTVSLSLHLLLV